jgi:dipeptidyl aminopeptidase/acylaminoacyl peptidase
MNPTPLRAAAFLLLAMSLPPATRAAPPPQIPLRDFFRNPEKTSFQLSEDGKSVAFLAPYERRMNLFVQPRGAAEARRVTSETDRSLAGYLWKGSDRLLYIKDFGGDENYHLFSVDAAGKERRDLTPFEKVKVGFVSRLWDDPRHVLIEMNRRKKEVFDVYRVDVATGKLDLVAENPGNITGWIPDHEGRVRAAVTTDGVNASLLFRDNEGDPFRVVITTNFRDSLSPEFFTFDNRNLFVSSNLGRDKVALVEFDPRAAREVRVLAERPDVDMGGLSFSRKRKVLTAAGYTTWKPEQLYFDAETEAMARKIRARLPGYEIDGLDNRDRAEETFIVHAWNDRTRGAEYLYDKKAESLVKLADHTPWLREQDMAPMKPVEYRSRDGLLLHGYLTLPAGRPAKDLPVVVNPHGGPWARDTWGFDPEVQFLANRGYAVFQVNFRGSTGYGKKFWEASFKQWGRTMQDDVSDGVAWLVREGVADPKRLAIYGGSYGGYATLAGVAFTPHLYACGVDYVGVANMFTFLKTIPPYWKPYLDMFHEMVGDPVKDKKLLEEVSPALHADRIRVPMLIAQGANDPRVNKDESDQMVAALRKRGVPVEYLVKADEGHGFHNEENRFEFYGAMEKFLARHLGPR